MRKKVIIGNWKMHGGLRFSQEYLELLLPMLASSKCSRRVLLGVPYPLLYQMKQQSIGSILEIGAQNAYGAMQGAFTGEVSPKLLKEVGADFVILGHSERRQIFHETGAEIRNKLQAVLEVDLQPVICIGETLSDREGGNAFDVLSGQIRELVEGLEPERLASLMLAYEPIWAIGTGKSATVELVEQVHRFCRLTLSNLLGENFASRCPILYGGSVHVENAPLFLSREEIDGVLVGGASLDVANFIKIIQS